MSTNRQQPTGNDELWMEEALRSAQRALEAGEVPVEQSWYATEKSLAGDGIATLPTPILRRTQRLWRCARPELPWVTIV